MTPPPTSHTYKTPIPKMRFFRIPTRVHCEQHKSALKRSRSIIISHSSADEGHSSLCFLSPLSKALPYLPMAITDTIEDDLPSMIHSIYPSVLPSLHIHHSLSYPNTLLRSREYGSITKSKVRRRKRSNGMKIAEDGDQSIFVGWMLYLMSEEDYANGYSR
ncbi:hypothetical protein NPIL_568241 [Nephila pilipes]|uniref:Uncharacterized protein n=1 Tax=Nephila pilipes TaxID=299642 RepID=A0A8X6MGH7_NEPPI|nr:hypothetical protein NPIL_568241 [Nephila pilipes]